nr:restriction endonuclease subunit S [Mesorhizobium sp. M5C.F.Ca.IN.020.32.2.1]
MTTKIGSGATPTGGKEAYLETGIPLIRSLNVYDLEFVYKDLAFMDVMQARKLSHVTVQEKDVLLNITGASVARCCPAPKELAGARVNQHVAIIRADAKRAWGPYLARLLASPLYKDKLLATAGGGATREALTKAGLEQFEVQLPELEAQRRYASILSAYDDLIDNNTRRIAGLEEMARRIYEEWFVHFRAPGCEGLPLVDSPLGPIPEGWTVTELMDFCQRITDGAHKSPPTAQNGRLMASVKDMTDWEFEPSGCRIIDDADYSDLVRNDCKPLVGDILIAKDGANLNKHTFLVCEDLDIVLLSSIAIVRPKPETHKEFLVSALKSDAVSRRIKDSRTGAAIPRIILKDFKRLLLVTPPITLMQQFDKLIHSVHSLCRRLSRANRNLRAQRDLLLPKLISGEIDLSQAEELMEAAE